MKLSVLLILGLALVGQADDTFRVLDVDPGNKTQGVELDPLIQIHVSEKFDPASVTEDAVKLLQLSDKQIVAVNVSGDLGGVITLSVDQPLRLNTEYELSVTVKVKSRMGDSLKPLSVRFRTTDKQPPPLREDISGFRFEKLRIDQRDGVCGLAIAGGRLFACTWDGKLLSYTLNASGELVGEPKLEFQVKRRINAVVADPASTPEKIILWLSYDSQQGLSLGPNDFSGALVRVTLGRGVLAMQEYVSGLPTGDHPASGLVFGPDGRLFVSQGALSMLGGKPEQPETPLSAATLAIDLKHPIFRNGPPVDVREYDAATNPDALQVYATGIREAFDLCWHSSGSLFAGVNMNDTNDKTPQNGKLPAVNVRPSEMMLRIVEGQYYGHPNPSRNEWVLLGGNPTDEVDPWEVSALPVGTMPEKNFDPSLLIRDLERDKGPSADGVCEWMAEGALAGRLLFCFYTATRGIHTYQVVDEGKSVADHQPLVDSNNRILRFGAPLDIVHDPRGWLYVADFSAPERGDSGRAGGIWLVKPLGNDD